MPHFEPFRETRTFEVIDVQNDPLEEVTPLSDIDCTYIRTYLPITSTYKLTNDVDKELVIANLCKGLQQTMQEYRFMAGNVQVNSKGRFFVKRSPAQRTFTVHINHLEHTDFPSYAELEQREFPFSELDDQHLPPNYCPIGDATTKPDEGHPVTLIQLNTIRGGIIIGTAIHHQCVGAKGIDAVIARWAAHTRALFTDTPAPAFDASCLDQTPLNSTTPLPPNRIPEVEDKIKSLKYIPVLPDMQPAPPCATAQAAFHFPASKLAALKAATQRAQQQQQPGAWVSTNDCLTALLWRAMQRVKTARSPDAANDDPGRSVNMLQAVDIRDHHDPPIPHAYPGNTVFVSFVAAPHGRVGADGALPELARAVRASVARWRARDMIEDVKDYIATFPDKEGVRLALGAGPELDTVVTSWGVMTAYRSHDFGFGPLRALRVALGSFKGMFVILPRRIREEERDEGIEVFVSLDKDDMERMKGDEEVLKWGEVRW